MGSSTATARSAKELTRERILEAAERLFLEKGFNATSVRDIAAEADYTTGAVYGTFKSKAELFLQIAHRQAERERQSWEDTVTTLTPEAWVARLLASAATREQWTHAVHEFLAYAYRDEPIRDEV